MAENNLLMTIVLVVAATLLFSGGLTGNASYQEKFGFQTVDSSVNRGGEVECSKELQGGYTSDGQPAIFQQETDCTKTVKDICPKSSKPFITNERVVECRGLAISSANDDFLGAQ